LEEQILTLQNVLMGLQNTRQRLEKKVEEQAEQLLKVDQEYRNYQKELVNFAKNMIGRLEGERRRLSLYLHDNVAQGLATIKLLLEDKLALLTKDESSSSFSIDSILEITQDNLNEIRRIIDDLRPRMLDDIGLLATLQWYWKKFQDRRPKFRLSMKLAAAETDIPPKLKLVIYRIVQEASDNIERHSGATCVEFKLTCEDQTLKLEICDNGIGFNVDAIQKEFTSHPGLISMKEYTELSDGRYDLRSYPNKGTCIEGKWYFGNRHGF
jgi:signal transduction histidine kinase